MGSNNINLDQFVREQDSGFAQVSYLGHSTYDDHIPQTTYRHVFSSSNLFPDLNEYSKLQLADGFGRDDLSFTQQAMATLRLVETAGSFKNVVGHYVVDQDGTISNVNIAIKNTRTAEPGLTHSFNVSGNGNALNFFIVAHGYAMNREFADLDATHGYFNFVYKQGSDDERLAKVTDKAEDITLIYEAGDGKVSKIRGPVFHSTKSESENNLNSDGENHAVSGVLKDDNDQSVLRIGFEDFPGLGDADFNDVVFDLNVSYLHPDFGSKKVTDSSLNGLMPSSGNDDRSFVEGTAASKDGLGEDRLDGGGLNNGGMDKENNTNGPPKGFNTHGEFNVYVLEQMGTFLPEMYGEIKQALYQHINNPDKFDALFIDYLKENFADIYNELLTDFQNQNSSTSPLVAGSSNEDLDVILMTDQVDEAIHQFISMGVEANTISNHKQTEPTHIAPVTNGTSIEDFHVLSSASEELV